MQKKINKLGEFQQFIYKTRPLFLQDCQAFLKKKHSRGQRDYGGAGVTLTYASNLRVCPLVMWWVDGSTVRGAQDGLGAEFVSSKKLQLHWTWFLRPHPHQGLSSSSVKRWKIKMCPFAGMLGQSTTDLGGLRQRKFVLSQLWSSGWGQGWFLLSVHLCGL